MDDDDLPASPIDSYRYAMARARRNRQQRATETSAAVLHYLWPQLARSREASNLTVTPKFEASRSLEQVRWSVRGEPRTRATFGLPHPADFPGGLPLPGEYSISRHIPGKA